MSNKKFVEKITSMDEDFAQWYTDVVTKAELVDYSSVRGSMIIRPYGYALWENIKSELDKKIKETGHENVYMPLFIPESLLQKRRTISKVLLQKSPGSHMVVTKSCRNVLLSARPRKFFWRALQKHHPFLPRPTKALQPVGECRAVGKNNPAFPPHPRVSLAGRAHLSRNGRTSTRRNCENAKCVRGHLRKLSSHSSHKRAKNRKRKVRWSKIYLYD